MSCNCATQAQIESIYKKYGEGKRAERKNMPLEAKIQAVIMDIMVVICSILISPFIFGYVLVKAFSKDRQISLRKFFNLKGGVLPEFNKTAPSNE